MRQHCSVYRTRSRLLLSIFSTQQSLKADIVKCILQMSKLGSERLINLFKIPLWTNIRPKIGMQVFGLRVQYSFHSITASILEKQISAPR